MKKLSVAKLKCPHCHGSILMIALDASIKGRPPLGKKAMTGAERTRRHRAKIRKMFDEELGKRGNVVEFKG